MNEFVNWFEKGQQNCSDFINIFNYQFLLILLKIDYKFRENTLTKYEYSIILVSKLIHILKSNISQND